jgi:DNA primase
VKERLKKEVSIQRRAEARGIKLRRVGKELIVLCPFHDDRNPRVNREAHFRLISATERAPAAHREG